MPTPSRLRTVHRPFLRTVSRALQRARLRALVLALLPLAAAGCYTDPTEELAVMQATIDLQDTLNELGLRTTELQFTLDSLRMVVAKQDSTISRLANLAGVPYQR